MAEQIISTRPPKATKPMSLAGRSLQIPAGTEVVLGSVQLLRNAWPVLETLYYDGSAGGDGSLRFRVTLNGQELPYEWANRTNPKGFPGSPDNIGQELPAGGLLEVRCKNEHATDPFDAFSDGQVDHYVSPIY